MANQRSSGSSSRSKSGNRSSSGNRSRSSSRSGGSAKQSGNGADPSRAATEALEAAAQNGAAIGEPDVLLDVPQLKVDEITLEVDNLHARIALETRLGDLLQLYVGADVVVDRVALEIKGVDAQAQLKARLHNVLTILDRALETIDQNPKLLTDLAKQASESVEAEAASEKG